MTAPRTRMRVIRPFTTHVVNPIARHFASWLPGFGILEYRGRKSGRTYRTPINVFRRGDWYIFALTYGADVEWVKNVAAAGDCILRKLLRYRLLDRELDERLHRVARLVEDTSEDRQGLFKPSEIRQALRELMRVRSTSIVEFQDVEREIKLIGDWYSARLYELVTRRFRVEDWRHTVKEKLDGLEGIYAIASDRFTVSWERRARVIELVAWYILLLGWGVLLALDFYALRR